MNKGTWKQRLLGGPTQYKGVAPARATAAEIESFFDEAQSKPFNPRTRNELRAWMQALNFVRWRRLEKDFAWMQREMKKLGLNPEDARWLP